MLDILANRTFRHLFAAQVVALLGTGLATVALGLLAYDLAGGDAGFVLGMIFTIKMVAYVGVSPFAGAVADRVDRRKLLIALDLIRAAAALCLPFVTQTWQVYGLIFVLQSASAAFTPTFQATIPDVLPDEAQYTRALSLSRLAYDLENIISPTLAALLLLLASYGTLFFGTALGFVASALLILPTALPTQTAQTSAPFRERATRGISIYLKTPRLRGLLALNLAVAAGGAMVLVNSVVLVRDRLGLDEAALAWTMLAFGLGSMIAALALPRLLDRFRDRPVVFLGAMGLTASMLLLATVLALGGLSWPILLAAWVVAGIGYSGVLTPSGRLLRRSVHPQDRPAIFAAQFALSHACWLVTYPLAGTLMTYAGGFTTLVVLSGVCVAGIGIAALVWPVEDRDLPHSHDDLPPDHPHLKEGHDRSGTVHSHEFVIDHLHHHWPEPRGNG